MIELVEVLEAVAGAKAEAAIDGRNASVILKVLRADFPPEYNMPRLAAAISHPTLTDWNALREEVTLGVNALIVGELNRRTARAAQARQAARKPRKSRLGDDLKARALGRAKDIRTSRPALTDAAVAELVLDWLSKEGLQPPNKRTILRWMQKG